MNMDAPTQEQFDIPIQDRKVHTLPWLDPALARRL